MDVQHGRGLSPFGAARSESDANRRRARLRRAGLAFVRYGIPLAIFVAGVAILIAEPDHDTALLAGFTFFGVAVGVLMLNVFFRIGVRGDLERDQEEAARRYFDRHGRWPDERGT